VRVKAPTEKGTTTLKRNQFAEDFEDEVRRV
jgi:hypothetical protein